MSDESSDKFRHSRSSDHNRRLKGTSRSQSYPDAHASDYLQSAVDSLNLLIHKSEENILDEQKLLTNEEHEKLNKIQTFRNEIGQVEDNIYNLNNEIEQLTSKTCEMLVRQNQTALTRHSKLLKESVDHMNQVLRSRSLADNPQLEQLRKSIIAQQEELFFIRSQLDIDHNQLTTNVALLKQCCEQRTKLEQDKTKTQMDLQNVQIQDIEKQLKIGKLQLAIAQQTRVRDEIQQLHQYVAPNEIPRQRNKSKKDKFQDSSEDIRV